MTATRSSSTMLQSLLADTLAPDEERAAVEELIKTQPTVALSLLMAYLEQKHRYREDLEACRDEAERLAASLQDNPWHPAIVVRALAGTPPRALVAVDGRRVVVGIAPDVDASGLRCGAPVFLNSTATALVHPAEARPLSGAVGIFSRLHQGMAILRGPADEEIVVDVADDLRETLKAGDLLCYDSDGGIAVSRVEKGATQAAVIEEIPDVTFDAIGGLDDVIEELKSEVALHVLHPEVAARHRLTPSKGIVLDGPPGCGKTMIAKALANHLGRRQGITALFLNVKPGVHRSMWYGKTEENIRDLFALARRAAADEGKFVVMFFDDVDHLGSRGDSAATAVDARVLPCFLGEIDGLAGCPNVWLLAATNRTDLLDEAFLRPGRFGDKVFRIPRPGRQAARDIFRKHLVPDLPYWGVNGEGAEPVRDTLIEEALASIYAPNGEAATLGTLVLRDGSRRAVTAPEVMSGALIAQAVADAKRRSALRAVRGQPSGLTARDLLEALDRQLAGITQRLKPGPALRQTLDLSSDLDVVRVEVDVRRRGPGSHLYLAPHDR